VWESVGGDQITHLLSKSLLMYQICGRCPDHAPHKIGLEQSQSPQQSCCNNGIHKVSDLTLKKIRRNTTSIKEQA
jgi:hypothetical protein